MLELLIQRYRHRRRRLYLREYAASAFTWWVRAGRVEPIKNVSDRVADRALALFENDLLQPIGGASPVIPGTKDQGLNF